MDAFQTNVDSLKILFELMNSGEQDTALVYMATMYEKLQEIRLRSRITEEAEKSISEEAERIIFNRLAGQLVANMEFGLKGQNICDEEPVTQITSGSGIPEEIALDFQDETEEDNNKFTCATCGFMASNRKALYRHGKRFGHQTRQYPIQEGYYVCSFCNYSTERKYNLERHLQRAHFGLRNHACDVCGQRFKDKDCLRSHVKRMHNSST